MTEPLRRRLRAQLLGGLSHLGEWMPRRGYSKTTTCLKAVRLSARKTCAICLVPEYMLLTTGMRWTTCSTSRKKAMPMRLRVNMPTRTIRRRKTRTPMTVRRNSG